MNIKIRKLSPDLANDFFDFFDNRAFTDNSPEGPCYCTRYQMTKEQEKAELFDKVTTPYTREAFMPILRQIAQRQIESGAMEGYLAFVDGVSIGWCNVNDKANFPIESGNGARLYAPAEKREKAIVCFQIAPKFRGKGVATALLQQVIIDAKAEGYIAIESNPQKRDERYEWDFLGPVRLYEKAGFIKVAEQDKMLVMRKLLN